MKQIINASKIINNTKAKLKNTHARIIEYSLKHKIGLAFWILMLVTFILGALFFADIKDFIKNIVYNYGLIGIFLTAVLTELVVLPIGPDAPLIAGILLGLNHWLVFAHIIAGAYLAIIISYYIGKKIGLPGVERIMGTDNYKKVQKYETRGKVFLLLGALTPVPYVPYLAGVWKLSLKDTILYVALPRTIRLFAVFIMSYFLGVTIFQ